MPLPGSSTGVQALLRCESPSPDRNRTSDGQRGFLLLHDDHPCRKECWRSGVIVGCEAANHSDSITFAGHGRAIHVGEQRTIDVDPVWSKDDDRHLGPRIDHQSGG